MTGKCGELPHHVKQKKQQHRLFQADATRFFQQWISTVRGPPPHLLAPTWMWRISMIIISDVIVIQLNIEIYHDI